MALFKSLTPEEQAAKDADKAGKRARDERIAAERQAEKERQAFLRTPVGRAHTAYENGDHLFQYSHDIESQEAVVVAMVGSTTKRQTTDPTEILNAVCKQGWELVNGSFVFREQGSQSRDKFMSSGQNIAVKGTTIGYYLFRRCADNRVDD